MALFSVYAFTLSGFMLLLTVSAMDVKHSKHPKNAGEMHKMIIPSKKKFKVENDEPANSEMNDPLHEFCRTLDKYNDWHAYSDVRSLNELKNACDGSCSYCVDCAGSCRDFVSRGCAGLFKNKPSVLKMRSPLEDECKKFLE